MPGLFFAICVCVCKASGAACGQQASDADQAARIAVVEAAGGRVGLTRTLADMGTIGEVRFNHRVTDEDLQSLLAVPEARGVRITGGFRVTDTGLAPLAKMPRLYCVELLACVNVGDPAMEYIKGAKELVRLNITRTRVTGKGLAKLSKVKSLVQLNVAYTSIGDEDLRLVENWPRLRELRLYGTKVADAGLAHLKAAKSLESLYLSGLPITDAGVVHLAKLPALRWVFLSHTKVTEQGLETLRKALPKVRIVVEP